MASFLFLNIFLNILHLCHIARSQVGVVGWEGLTRAHKVHSMLFCAARSKLWSPKDPRNPNPKKPLCLGGEPGARLLQLPSQRGRGALRRKELVLMQLEEAQGCLGFNGSTGVNYCVNSK